MMTEMAGQKLMQELLINNFIIMRAVIQRVKKANVKIDNKRHLSFKFDWVYQAY